MGFNFSETLQGGMIKEIRKVPKSDLHNHCLLGGKRSVIEKYYGKKLTKFKAAKPEIGDLNRWIANEYRPFFELPYAFEKAVEAAFIQARFDGVTKLEMSIDVLFGNMFNVPVDRIVKTLKHYHQIIAPEIDFCPELGFSRSKSLRTLLHGFELFLDHHYFRSVDLYDDEFAQPIANFKELYRLIKKLGMKCKAHAGEFGSADSVKETVEVLELDVVQHGLGAAASPAVMKWLADHKIPLNICPTSNIKMKRVRSYKTHPIRILFDHGVKVTVNTDDALIFGDGASEQYLKLYKAGVFTAEELDIIRISGFSKY
ncbi:MAG: adenosine deaminase [Bacteroidota bacterium]